MPGQRYLSSGLLLEFRDGLAIFRGAGRPVVPNTLIFHIAHALALSGFGDDRQGSIGAFTLRGIVQHLLIVTVYRANIPSKRLEFRFERQQVGVTATDGGGGDETI